jgi:hypothetical protein
MKIRMIIADLIESGLIAQSEPTSEMRMKNQLYDLEDLSQFCGFGTIFGPYL